MNPNLNMLYRTFITEPFDDRIKRMEVQAQRKDRLLGPDLSARVPGNLIRGGEDPPIPFLSYPISPIISRRIESTFQHYDHGKGRYDDLRRAGCR